MVWRDEVGGRVYRSRLQLNREGGLFAGVMALGVRVIPQAPPVAANVRKVSLTVIK